jgi:3,4-dihydroxy-2-butanone 4-phosphate synthase
METAFTVSVDLKVTGNWISATDRAKTILSLVIGY